METSTLLYDDSCPLCRAYTKAFVSSGMLKPEGRISFSSLKDQEFKGPIDWNRARNEIPYADERTGNVYYGADALLKILSSRWSFFSWYARQKSLVWLAKKLYAFVSYNRRVIITGKPAPCTYDAKPDFNLWYRIAYLLVAWLVSSLALTSYAALLTSYTGTSSFGREFIICGGQIIFQSALLIAAAATKEKTADYLGNMMTVSLAGSLLLLPMLITVAFCDFLPAFIPLAWFGMVVCGMLYEHMRRVQLLSLPKWISAGWVVYRLLVLIIILYSQL